MVCFSVPLPAHTTLQTTTERDSGESYSDQEEMEAYIPQIPDPNFSFPLIGADLSHFSGKFCGWRDPMKDYSAYSLSQDVEALGSTPGECLSIVKQYF